MRHLLVVIGIVLVPTNRAHCEPPATAADSAKPRQATIATLVERLDSPHFAVREAASKTIEALGEPALEALQKAAETHKSAEVRQRARRALQTIQKQDFDKLIGRWRIIEAVDEGRTLPKEVFYGEIVFSWSWEHLRETRPLLRELFRLDEGIKWPERKSTPPASPALVTWDVRWVSQGAKGWMGEFTDRRGLISYGREQSRQVIDLTFNRPYPNHREKKQLKGIYRVEGDTLILCAEMQGGDRPKQFETKNTPSRLLLRCQRVPEPPSALPPRTP